MKENNYMTGKVYICLTDRSGKIIREDRVSNMIVDSGRLLMARLFTGAPEGGPVRYMGTGSGDAATTADMTALENEIEHLTPDTSARTLIEHPQVTDDPAGAAITLSATFTGDDFIAGDAEEKLLKEAGLFTDPTGGVMYNRVTFDAIPLRKGYEIKLIWEVNFPAA